ncbi:hypothetical protein JOE31_003574 [Arthrobacter sp. PvP023]|uniref:hypothetical protein n=1 Tax=Micrococcaceae TaxID=1268 RepID=UPI001AE40BF7|nr:hypothetical protein [Arthrobacter sp. PvP023]MBP1137342.1 hypothetical protein [Arthrobacter sp. PvP023]
MSVSGQSETVEEAIEGVVVDGSPVNEPDVGEHPDPESYYFARFGSLVLLAADDDRTPEEERTAIIEALKSDPRVVHVSSEPLETARTNYRRIFPPRHQTDVRSLLLGEDIHPALKMSHPISFKVHVPLKNQPLFSGYDDLPTEDYWVTWDGFTAIVMWQRSEFEMPTRSGGHIVVDMLEEAAKKAGMRLHVQACSPGCANMFAHRVMKVQQYPGEDGYVTFQEKGFPVVEVHLHSQNDPEDVLAVLGANVFHVGQQFALYKNVGRRVLDMESTARAIAADLLEIDYDRLLARSKHLPARFWNNVKDIPAKLTGKGARQREGKAIAELWIAMSSIEATRRDWVQHRLGFLGSADSQGRLALYDIDRTDDDVVIQSLNLDFIRSAVEQKSRAIDNKSIALATIAGAIAAALGGVAGAIMSKG